MNDKLILKNLIELNNLLFKIANTLETIVEQNKESIKVLYDVRNRIN